MLLIAVKVLKIVIKSRWRVKLSRLNVCWLFKKRVSIYTNVMLIDNLCILSNTRNKVSLTIFRNKYLFVKYIY